MPEAMIERVPILRNGGRGRGRRNSNGGNTSANRNNNQREDDGSPSRKRTAFDPSAINPQTYQPDATQKESRWPHCKPPEFPTWHHSTLHEAYHRTVNKVGEEFIKALRHTSATRTLSTQQPQPPVAPAQPTTHAPVQPAEPPAPHLQGPYSIDQLTAVSSHSDLEATQEHIQRCLARGASAESFEDYNEAKERAQSQLEQDHDAATTYKLAMETYQQALAQYQTQWNQYQQELQQYQQALQQHQQALQQFQQQINNNISNKPNSPPSRVGQAGETHH
ncbi:unknown protein [Seminavis robusta]|uniref:Uncharacterized protein n=1 Tax=Seminavis robusta TaxID=568900 RepID=A0A9N8DJ02_9STRA|nr:unknown protein [Seminavis robusta]|eukprot:Sro147_g067840.1 n/a (278) ;mRNA; f:51336-52620